MRELLWFNKRQKEDSRPRGQPHQHLYLEGAVVFTSSFAMFAVQNTSVLGITLICKQSMSEVTTYLAPLAGVPRAHQKVNEAEPTFASTSNIPGFEVSMSFPNTMKVPHQRVQLRSGTKSSSSMRSNYFGMMVTAYRSESVSSPHSFRTPSYESRMRTATPSPSNAL